MRTLGALALVICAIIGTIWLPCALAANPPTPRYVLSGDDESSSEARVSGIVFEPFDPLALYDQIRRARVQASQTPRVRAKRGPSGTRDPC